MFLWWNAHQSIVNTPFQSPAHAKFEHMFSASMVTYCGAFEKNLMRCTAAYGMPAAYRYCQLENKDFQECISHDKSNARIEIIRAQRKKNYREGKINKALLRYWPPMECTSLYRGDWYSNTPLGC